MTSRDVSVGKTSVIKKIFLSQILQKTLIFVLYTGLEGKDQLKSIQTLLKLAKKRGVKGESPKQRELPHISLKLTNNTDEDSFLSSLNDFDGVKEDLNNEQQVAELICDTNKVTQTEIPKKELAKLLGDRIDRIFAQNTSVCPESNENVKIVSNLFV